jgi:uncharacterized protein (TIGR02301 family)
VRRRVGALAFVLLCVAGPVGAAESTAPTPPARPTVGTKPAKDAGSTGDAKAEPAPAPQLRPPYEAPLLRLAEMMGALAYLRDLCGAGDGVEFRKKMDALVQAEGVGDSTRDLMAGAYNEAYRGYASSYRACTPAANEVIGRFLAETARLAADVASRYGG